MGNALQRSIVLETRALTKQFEGLLALNSLDFEVELGRIHGVIGPNGAGKTTLFNLISGSLRPTAGHIFFKGRDVTGHSPSDITSLGIARKFQIAQVFDSLSVEENVTVAVQRQMVKSVTALLRGIDAKERVYQLLELVYLSGKARTLAGDLAHGERQRLELGMVLGTGAELLLLDEPTSGMSLEERDEIGHLLRVMSKQATILITEHDFPFIKQVADIITVLNRGERVAEGNVQDIECNTAVRECYLGTA